MLVVAIAAAPAIPAAAQPPAAAPSWRVTTLDHVDLWYHGVALLGVAVPEPAGLYDAAYAPAVRRLRAQLRVAATPLERASRDLASTFQREPAFATPTLAIQAGYYHAFRNSISGPLLSPAGPAPGTSVTSSLSEDSFLIQFSIRALPSR